jgi:hypothetical protein
MTQITTYYAVIWGLSFLQDDEGDFRLSGVALSPNVPRYHNGGPWKLQSGAEFESFERAPNRKEKSLVNQ